LTPCAGVPWPAKVGAIGAFDDGEGTMHAPKPISFNDLVEQHLGRRLPAALAGMIDLAALPPEAQEIVRRMLALMQRAAYPASEFNPLMLHLLGVVTPAMLPAAWGGRIPPVTLPGRHRKLDAYLAQQRWPADSGRPVLVDLGCGFPPVTTAETAAALAHWTVFGVDRAFAPYVLYDAAGHYASFDREGRFQYFQPRSKPLHADAAEARARFEALFAAMAPLLEPGAGRAGRTVEQDGHKLVADQVRDFETPHLKFIEADLEALRLPPARVVRCMNVLLYFESKARRRMLAAIAARLADEGLLLAGFNHPCGIYARYTVYRKAAAGLAPVEFAFGADNLRPLGVGPWLALQAEDAEAEFLADLTGAIRSDRAFWPDFNRAVDAQLAELGVCRRGADGFNRFPGEVLNAPPKTLWDKTRALWRTLAGAGYTDGAVAALRRAGYRAWKNPVGDIAVRPPDGALDRPCA
jgi:hypothetical protein